MTVSETLLIWYQSHKRPLPWRETQDAYKIWASEVILQQTRVVQGLPYYQRFIQEFPDVVCLAGADEGKLLHLWQGLGYYTRARNMHKAAKEVVNRFKGIFPTDQKALLSLPGIGQYTSAAIASIAGGYPIPVVDGNVIRIITRIYGIEEDSSKPAILEKIRILAGELLIGQNPGEMNQAMMEFGALQCTPGIPECKACPLQEHCVALAKGLVADIPTKAKKAAVSHRYLHALVILVPGISLATYLHKRTKNDIWQGLYTFPFIEAAEPLDLRSLLNHPIFQETLGHDAQAQVKQGPGMVHILTHQELRVRFFFISLQEVDDINELPAEWQKVFVDKLGDFPMPRLMHRFLEQYPGINLVNLM